MNKKSTVISQTVVGPRVSALWYELPSYLSACLRSLAQRHHARVIAVRRKLQTDHRWNDDLHAGIDAVITLPDEDPLTRWEYLRRHLELFRPDIVLCSGWTIPEFLAGSVFARKHGATTVCCMDTQWAITPRRLASLPFSRVAVGAFDFFWVPGPLQAKYARMLGFSKSRTMYGIYCCDSEIFGQTAQRRLDYLGANPYPKSFLYVGSFVSWKGLRTLLAAYASYRASSADPWTLVCVGGGPEMNSMAKVDGLHCVDFVQPSELASFYLRAGAFILPSIIEPHGVVVHEAATVGLPILCTTAAGAGLDFVRDGYNGYLFDADDPPSLAMLMAKVASNTAELVTMGQRSRCLANQLTTERWADYLVSMVTPDKAS